MKIEDEQLKPAFSARAKRARMILEYNLKSEPEQKTCTFRSHIISLRTETRLQDAMDDCEDNDKSIEFMIAYMGDVADVDHETVMDFLISKSDPA